MSPSLWCSDERHLWRRLSDLASSSALVASPFRIYNVCFSGVWGHYPCCPDSAVFFNGFNPPQGLECAATQ